MAPLRQPPGEIKIPDDAHIGYVPQLFTESTSLSGGQRFNEALTKVLSRTSQCSITR